MRRGLGVVLVSALLGVLWPRLAIASLTQPIALDAANLRAQVFSRAFGERGLESRGAFTAGNSGESFFARFAFNVAPATGSGVALIAVPDVSLPLLSSKLFAPAALPLPATISIRDDDYRVPVIATPASGSTAEPETSIVAAYQGSASGSTPPPSAFHFDLTSSTAIAPRLVTFSPVLDPQHAFTADSAGADAGTTLPQTQAGLAVPVRLGHVHLQTHVEGAQAFQSQADLRDNAVNAGATFQSRVGSHKVDVDVSSGFEHMTVNSPIAASSGFDGTSSYELSNLNLPVLVPAYADVSKRTLSAGVGVPVARNVSVQVQYDAQRLQGGYGAPGLVNLDARNDVYGGRVTLQIPHSASAISLSAKQYRYQDNLLPSNAFTQTSADVNFTVKF